MEEAISKLDLANSMIPKPFLIYSSPHKITFDNLYEEKDSVYIRTDLRDPNYEVLKFHTKQINKFTSFIPPNDLVLKDFTYLNDSYFGLEYLSEGKYLGVIVDRVGQVKKKLNAFNGGGIDFGRKSDQEAICYYRSYISGYNYEVIDLKDLKSQYVQRTRFNRAYEWDPYKYADIKVTTYQNNEGQKVPITIITNKKKFKKGGDAPALIKVYGGYGIGDEPSFDWENYFFVQNGGVLVFPGVRGGGAKGADWGLAGRGLKKQNTIDDVIASAEYIIKEKYVRKGEILLEGSSHGGFVVAAAGVQRPELFAGVVANVGVFDLISGLDESVGHAELNREEFGDPTDSVSVLNRFKLSPIHNLEDGVEYPAFLLITGRNDTRVAPSQSYRFLAALKDMSSNPNNFLIVTSGGHYLTNQPDEQLEIMSVKFKFLWLITGYKFWKRF